MTKAREIAELGAVYDSGALSNRNFLINGAMTVAQRGTSFSVSGASQSIFTLDRFRFGNDAGDVTITQNSVTDLPGFANSAKMSVTATGSLPTGDQCVFEQKIEAQNCIPFGHGTSSASPLTLSFYAKSNNTDTRVAWFYNPDAGRMVSKTFANTAANTWEKITIEIPADTGGTGFNDDNGSGLYVRIVLASGSQFTGGINTSWVALGNDRYQGVSNFLASTSNYFEVTGMQLEVGDTATPFEHRSYGDELARCMRYYWRLKSEGYNTPIAMAQAETTTVGVSVLKLPVQMRAIPTFSDSGGTNDFFYYDGGSDVFSSFSGASGSKDTSLIYKSFSSGAFTDNQALTLRFNDSDGFLAWDAEL
jgi:hypothetical protein